LYNITHLTGIADPKDSGVKQNMYTLYLIISGLMAAAFLYRILKREFSAQTDKSMLFLLHMADAGACMLLISPMAWEHHYVLAMPLAILAISAYRNTFHPMLWFGILLIFVFPVTDIFVLSLNRILGLLMLLYLTRPGILHAPTRPELSSENPD
jgi:hypothetical protein